MTISSPVGTVGTYTFTSGNGRHGSYVTGYTLAQAGPGAVATAMALAGETVHQDTPATELGHSSFKGYVRPTWTAASDAQDAYSKGDRVTFQGAVWESTMDANVWSPTAYPAGWKKAG